MELSDIKKINFKQSKYIFPLVLYVIILGIGYFVVRIFTDKKAEISENTLESTEYLNASLPDAAFRDNGDIGSKSDYMKNAYGAVSDETAMETVEREEYIKETEDYESSYSDDDIAELNEAAERAEQAVRDAARDSLAAVATAQREQEAYQELERVLAEARLRSQLPTALTADDDTAEKTKQEGDDDSDVYADDESDDALVDRPHSARSTRSVRSPSDDDETYETVRKSRDTSEYFNTMGVGMKEPSLIKAIIDEDITAVDGSRVRLRLLDDVQISGYTLKKGTCMYATMSGFSSQRVKGQINTILVDDNIIKVSLSIYDLDGMEGLYVPRSSFRESTEDIASGVFNNTMSLNSGSSGSTLSNWAMQTVQNAYQKTSQALSKAIKKNRAKLKYGSCVYVVNSKDLSKKKDNNGSKNDK